MGGLLKVSRWRLSLLAFVSGCLVFAVAGCGSSPASGSGSGIIYAIGAENEYANVIQQVGGKYVKVVAFMSNPNTDPHVYEASTTDAADVAKASLIVQNGIGYDTFMNHLESASPKKGRIVITVESLLGLPAAQPTYNVENPHLWYNPHTMPRVAEAVAQDLGRLDPSHKAYFTQRANTFKASLSTWATDVTQLESVSSGKSVAVTEPVCDYLLQAGGLHISTPWAFQAAVMNGTDPSPEDVQIEDNLIIDHKVSFLAYNQQAVDAATEKLLTLAKEYNVPVVGVYETMPPHYDYQQWMEAETNAFTKALTKHISTVGLR